MTYDRAIRFLIPFLVLILSLRVGASGTNEPVQPPKDAPTNQTTVIDVFLAPRAGFLWRGGFKASDLSAQFARYGRALDLNTAEQALLRASRVQYEASVLHSLIVSNLSLPLVDGDEALMRMDPLNKLRTGNCHVIVFQRVSTNAFPVRMFYTNALERSSATGQVPDRILGLGYFTERGRVVDRRYDNYYSLLAVCADATLTNAVLSYTVKGTEIEVIDSSEQLDDFWKVVSGKNALNMASLQAIAATMQKNAIKSTNTVNLQEDPQPPPQPCVYMAEVRFKDADLLLDATARLVDPASTNDLYQARLGQKNVQQDIRTQIATLAAVAGTGATGAQLRAQTAPVLEELEFSRKVEAELKEAQKLAEADLKAKPLGTLRGPTEIAYHTREYYSFSLDYAVNEPDRLKYDKDNGVVTVKDADEKTPVFLSINYFPGGVDKKIKDAKLNQRLPAPFWNPFHFKAGFRTDLDNLEPMVGAGVGVRVLSASINFWGGVALEGVSVAKDGVSEGQPAAGSITDQEYDTPFLFGISIAWQP